MKKIFTLLLFITIFYNYSFSQSGLFGSIGGGISIPISSFSDNHNIGINAAGNIGLQFHKLIGARFDLQYNSFSYKDQTSYYGDITGDPYTLFTISGDAVIANYSEMKKSQGIVPYGVIGIGLYFGSQGDVKLGSLGTVTGSSETYLGVGLGGGAIFKLSKNMGIFSEVKYSTTFGGEQLNYLPFRLGVMFTP